MEERQLADIASGSGPPPPPGFAACAPPPVAFVGRASEGHAEATLPGYLPAPREFVDSEDDVDVDGFHGDDGHHDDDDNDTYDDDDDSDDESIDVYADLADMFSRRV